MSTTSTWQRYKGDGTLPPGAEIPKGAERGRYLADTELVTAVNTALAVEQPLLVTGQSGTGKTRLAWSIASELGLGNVLEFHTRSDHQAQDVLFSFDNLRRFYHATTNNPLAEDPRNYITYEPLGQAIKWTGDKPRLVLIDEIDKAPRDFPNDLLDEIDRMTFTVPETNDQFTATVRPVVVITSNSERQLPDPFLRRCVFHEILFPPAQRLQEILQERLGHLNVSSALGAAATKRFLELRELSDLEKQPATGELIVWVKVLHQAGVDPAALESIALSQVPFQGAVIKTRHDRQVVAKAS